MAVSWQAVSAHGEEEEEGCVSGVVRHGQCHVPMTWLK